MATKITKNIDKNLQPENKVPPNKVSNQSQTSEKEDQREINSSKEQLYLEGEPHIDPSSLDSKNKEDEHNMSSSLNSQNLKVMKQLTVNPREVYLKEKISKVNYNKRLINNIQKDINNQVNEIKTEIGDNKISINEKMKDLNKLMENDKIKKEKYLVKYSDKDYNSRTKHKLLSSLYEEEKILKAKLNQIEGNEALLKSEGFMKLNNSYESLAITPYDKSIKEKEMKNNKTKKNDIKERLVEIEFKIGQILQEENDKNFSKKEKLENYKQNFDRDKEIIKARADKYLKEIKERNKRISKDMEQLVEKRKKEIEKREKEEEDKKKQILDKFKEKEKEIAKKRLKEKQQIMAKYMPFRQLKLETKEKDYTYNKLAKNFENSENELLKKNILDKKNKMKMVTPEDLEKFREQIEIKKEELKKEKGIKEMKEKEKFEEAKNFKPKYKNKFNEKIDEELHNIIKEQKNKKEIINGLVEIKNNYGKKKVHQPGINEAKKKERLENIVKLEQPKLFQIKYTLKKNERNKSPKDKKSLEWIYKLKKENDQKYLNLYNSYEIENPLSLVKKPKNIRVSSSFTKNKKKENVNPKDINYLEILKKNNKNKTENQIILPKFDDNKNPLGNIEQMKEASIMLDKKVQMGEELLRTNGGVSNNPQLGKQIGDLYINSIGTKLKILNQVYENNE